MGILSGQDNFASIVGNLVGLMNMMVGVLVPLALAIFFWGLVRYIYEAPHEGHTHARETILWSLIALFVLISVWGILALLNVAFFGGASSTNYNQPTGQYQVNEPANMPSQGGLYPI